MTCRLASAGHLCLFSGAAAALLISAQTLFLPALPPCPVPEHGRGTGLPQVLCLRHWCWVQCKGGEEKCPSATPQRASRQKPGGAVSHHCSLGSIHLSQAGNGWPRAALPCTHLQFTAGVLWLCQLRAGSRGRCTHGNRLQRDQKEGRQREALFILVCLLLSSEVIKCLHIKRQLKTLPRRGKPLPPHRLAHRKTSCLQEEKLCQEQPPLWSPDLKAA